jgi:hypothetical protein
MNKIVSSTGIFKDIAPYIYPTTDRDTYNGIGLRIDRTGGGVVDYWEGYESGATPLREENSGVIDYVEDYVPNTEDELRPDHSIDVVLSGSGSGSHSGGGDMGPSSGLSGLAGYAGAYTDEWFCKRTLIYDADGNPWCYCPVDTHPVTGEPIQQWIPAPSSTDLFEPEEVGQDDEEIYHAQGGYDPYTDPCFPG